MLINMIADAFLILGCFGTSIYCWILSKKIRPLNQFDTGLGGAIAVLSVQVDDLQKTLKNTQTTATEAGEELKTLLTEANDVASRLDLLLIGVDDLVETESAPKPILQQPGRGDIQQDVQQEGSQPLMFSRNRRGRRA